VLVLNGYTHWGYNELMDMSIDELNSWCETAAKVYPKGDFKP
jgi:hypothetical protein